MYAVHTYASVKEGLRKLDGDRSRLGLARRGQDALRQVAMLEEELYFNSEDLDDIDRRVEPPQHCFGDEKRASQ
jgi:hypothetical protein